MMRFYGMNDREVLAMPFSRLLLLYGKIEELEVEEEMSALVAFHTPNPSERFRDLQERMYALRPGQRRNGKSVEQLAQTPGGRHVISASDGDDIIARRERQAAANERIKAEWERRNLRGDLPAGSPPEEGVEVPSSAV
jgi:hypothetical protein